MHLIGGGGIGGGVGGGGGGCLVSRAVGWCVRGDINGNSSSSSSNAFLTSIKLEKARKILIML